MSDDPREEMRSRRSEHEKYLPRIEQGLSPTDDDLGLATAVRLQEEMARGCKAFGERIRKHDRKGAE
jgi:hypothetical protein